MRKVIDDPRLIYKCCMLYYEENLSQQQIADMLGVSRVSVSRMLQAGRESGIVKIQVVSPNHLTYTRLEQDLEHAYGLKEALVVENSPLITQYDYFSLIGSETIRLLEAYLHDDDLVGVSMGMTLHNVCRATRTSTENINCTFVPIVGGISSGRSSAVDVHSNQIALSFARLFGGQYVEFFSPAMFSDKAILEGFMKEAGIRRITDYYKEIHTVIMGIGTPNRASSTMIRAGYITQTEIDELVQEGMVGDLSLQFFDGEGCTDKFQSFNNRVAGLPLDQLRGVENRICIGSGEHKAKAIRGAILGGFVNILVTDQSCAKLLLDMKNRRL